MAIVRSGTNALMADTDDADNLERTEDGATLDQTFLDGIMFADTDGSTMPDARPRLVVYSANLATE